MRTRKQLIIYLVALITFYPINTHACSWIVTFYNVATKQSKEFSASSDKSYFPDVDEKINCMIEQVRRQNFSPTDPTKGYRERLGVYCPMILADSKEVLHRIATFAVSENGVPNMAVMEICDPKDKPLWRVIIQCK